jgi:MtN3 and saliva related transmembrane protein
MTSNFMVEVVGFTAGILGLIAWIPQIIRVWHKGEHEGISLLTLASILMTLALWVVYGLLIDSLSLIISNATAFGLIGVVFIGVVRLRYFGPTYKPKPNLSQRIQSVFSEGLS